MKNYAITFLATLLMVAATHFSSARAADTLVLTPPDGTATKHAVLVAGDEEYRTEETMPMLAKILSQKHGFKCTVVFSWSADGKYIDPNNQTGLKGLAALDSADLMIIGTRFRKPNDSEAAHLTKFMDAGKPIIGIRTATHAFNGKGDFGGKIGFGEWGRKVLGEQWVSHHGEHRREGCRGVIESDQAKHPILSSVKDVFAPSDVYGVKHLTDDDTVLMRAAVTKTLEPDSPAIEGSKNDPMQAFAWLHNYTSPSGAAGKSFCTTGGASVDFVNEDLRRMVINASLHLTGLDVPAKADVEFVDPFYPSFYGFIREKAWWPGADMQPEDYGLGKSPMAKDPNGSPVWNFRPVKSNVKADAASTFSPHKQQRIVATQN